MLARPVVVRAASTLPGIPPVQAALSFNPSAATNGRRCPFTTARFGSASWRSMSVTHNASGRSALKFRFTRSGALVASGSETVVKTFLRRRLTPSMLNRPGSDGGLFYWFPTLAGSACWAA